jgi:tetratricopeptide (TPR) repeat protein
MIGTVPFAKSLLDRGRQLFQRGQVQAASDLLGRLATFRRLSADVAEAMHLQLAEIHLAGGLLKQARRQLAAALALRPKRAHSHFLLAGALADDEDCDPLRALRHYRRAAELDAGNPQYLCDWGLQALELEDTTTAFTALLRAGHLAQDDPEIMSRVAGGLRCVDAAAEAGAFLKAARFRHPRDQRWQALWRDHQYQSMRKYQQPTRRQCTGRPIFLAFPGAGGAISLSPADKERLRHDTPSGTPRPKRPATKKSGSPLKKGPNSRSNQ